MRGMDYAASPWNLELTNVETNAPNARLLVIVNGRYHAERDVGPGNNLIPPVSVASNHGFRPELTFPTPAAAAGTCTVTLTGTALTPMM